MTVLQDSRSSVGEVDESGLRLNWAAEEVSGSPQHRFEMTPAPGLTAAIAVRYTAAAGDPDVADDSTPSSRTSDPLYAPHQPYTPEFPPKRPFRIRSLSAFHHHPLVREVIPRSHALSTCST